MTKRTAYLSDALRAHLDRRNRIAHSLQRANTLTRKERQDLLTDEAAYNFYAAVIEDPTIRSTVSLMRAVWPEHILRRGNIISNGAGAVPANLPSQTMHATAIQLRKSLEWLDEEQRILKNSPITYVGPEVMDLIDVATTKMGDDAIHESDMIASEGFIYLARPIDIPDFHPVTGELSHDMPNPIRAISWHTTTIGVTTGGTEHGSGLIITCYSDVGLVRTVILPAIQLLSAGETKFQVPTPPPDSISDGWLYESEQHAWAFGRPWTTDSTLGLDELEDGPSTTAVPSNIATLRKWFLAFMRFCWQRILVPREPNSSDISRQLRRQFERSSTQLIQVMYLRRAQHDTGDTDRDGRSLTFQVLVRGHWRNQWYPSLGASTEAFAHRQIWIDPHIKGPAGAPFREAQKVTAVIR